jgi:L-ascorbate metabolism protein UlaG (beta-lactamase superfamily)
MVGAVCMLLSGIPAALSQDTLDTEKGPLVITPIKHGSLMFEFNGKIIHVDPVLRMGDYETMPKADILLITHHHGDHFDLNAIDMLNKPDTKLVATQKCMENAEGLKGHVMGNGDSRTVAGIPIRAVPAYNIKHKRDNGQPYHPKGEGNGYILEMGKKIYVAGDTENIPEMKRLEDIDVAFLPMNLPYTMSPEMAAKAALTLRPEILYPYHFGKTETSRLVDLLKDHTEIEIRIRDMGF